MRKEDSDFEQYFARKVDKISDDAISLLDTDLKNGVANVFLLPDNAYAVSPVGKTYNWLADGWDNPKPDNSPDWLSDKEIWREADKKTSRGYRITPSLSDVMAQKTMYDLKPVAEVAFNERTKIQDKEHLNNAVKFAAQLPEESRASLGRCFDSLDGFLNNWYKTYDLMICPDFVPHSFYWVFTKGDKQGMNGGIILHGLGETFAVELDAPKHIHWSVHT